MRFTLKALTTAQTRTQTQSSGCAYWNDMESRVDVILGIPWWGKKKERERELQSITCKGALQQIMLVSVPIKICRRFNKFLTRTEKTRMYTTSGQCLWHIQQKYLRLEFCSPTACPSALPRNGLLFLPYFSSTQFPQWTPVGTEKERGMKEEEKVGGRWMHWGLKEGEGRNQGCYK